MAEGISLDIDRALDYIGSLQAPEPPMQVEDAADPSLGIQPTIGPLAARLIDVIVRAKRIPRTLEIGTSLGYSACVLGRAALSHGGTVQSIEIDPRIAAIARRNILAAGLEGTVEVRVGDAKAIIDGVSGPFGLILQDGAKDDYLPMLDRLIELLEPGGVLVTDDVLFPVMVLPEGASGWARSIASYNAALEARTDLRTVWLPIGDGVAVSVKLRTA